MKKEIEIKRKMKCLGCGKRIKGKQKGAKTCNRKCYYKKIKRLKKQAGIIDTKIFHTDIKNTPVRHIISINYNANISYGVYLK